MSKKSQVLLVPLVLIILIFTANLAQAEIRINTNSSFVQKNYMENDIVKGKINMTFSELGNREFSAEFGTIKSEKKISLIEMLGLMNYAIGTNYFCEPMGCKDDYQTRGSGSSTKEIFIGKTKTVYGFLLPSDVSSINAFTFKISGDFGSDCENQVYIDLLNDGAKDFWNTKSSAEVCENATKNRGCFNPYGTIGELGISQELTKLQCELMKNIPPAPGYRISANVKKISGTSGVALYLYDKDKKNWAGDGCILSPSSDDYQEVYCDINYPSIGRIQEVYVCIGKKSASDNYKIKTETDNPCGGSGFPKTSIDISTDYDLSIQPLKYAPITQLEFNNALFKNLNNNAVLIGDGSVIKKYLASAYNSKCSSTAPCVIPFSIWGKEGKIVADSIDIKYETAGGEYEANTIYSLDEEEFKINSRNFTTFDIEKMGFEVPKINGNYTFRLFYDAGGEYEKRLIQEPINVKVGFDFKISPQIVLVGQNTVFAAETTKNISSSKWNFGDGSSIATSNNKKASHVYTTNKTEFVVEVSLTSQGGEVSTKKFKILVGEPIASANLTIQKDKARINKLRIDASSYPDWVKNKIQEKIGIAQMENRLNALKVNFEQLGNSGTNEQYLEIINTLLEMNVPHSVAITESGVAPIEAGFNNINLGHIKEMLNANISNDEELKGAIISWINKNYDGSIKYEIFSAIGDLGAQKIFTKYEITLTKKAGAASNQFYLIINYPETELTYGAAYNKNSVGSGSGTSILLDGSGQTNKIGFLIAEPAPNVAALGAYISPALSALPISGKPYGGIVQKEGFDWSLFFIGVLVVLVLALGVYIVLQSWYKKYYEKHLFKNSDELYNLINYIYNSRKIGMSDKEIRKSLSKLGWKGEQLTYAFNKIDGKRTGMWEIPLFKFMENRKVREEIEKRQHGRPVDVRFIKQPNLR